MPNYQNGKIYTIRCRTDENLIYVGSTCETLSRRMATHRGHSKEKPHLKLYEKVNGNWDDWYIELYEDCPNESKEQLKKREGEVIREIGNLNKNIAGRTKEEWLQDNPEYKEKIKAYKKEYWEKHKQEKAEHDKEYAEKNKEKIKAYQKEYREKNKEKK